MNERAIALSGATWIAIAFAGTYAARALPAVLRLPFAVVEASAPVQVGAGVAAAAITFAIEVAIVVLAIRRVGQAPAKPPWIAVIVAAVLAVFAYPLSVGSGVVVSAVAARQLGPEGLATIAVAGSVLCLVEGVLHLVLLVGVLLAVALRWQRAAEA